MDFCVTFSLCHYLIEQVGRVFQLIYFLKGEATSWSKFPRTACKLYMQVAYRLLPNFRLSQERAVEDILANIAFNPKLFRWAIQCTVVLTEKLRQIVANLINLLGNWHDLTLLLWYWQICNYGVLVIQWWHCISGVFIIELYYWHRRNENRKLSNQKSLYFRYCWTEEIILN